MTRRNRVFWVVVVAMLAAASFAPAAAAGGGGDEPASIDLVFTQPEPDFGTDPITFPGGYFTMSGDGAVCGGGLFYDEFLSGDTDTDNFQTYLNLHTWKVFTCDSGETFTLEFWVEFEIDASQEPDPFTLVFSSWEVSGSSIAGLTGSGTITYRNWDPNLEYPFETWSGFFGVFDCKKGGWESRTDAFGTPFKNQGDCVSYLATGGRNLAAG